MHGSSSMCQVSWTAIHMLFKDPGPKIHSCYGLWSLWPTLRSSFKTASTLGCLSLPWSIGLHAMPRGPKYPKIDVSAQLLYLVCHGFWDLIPSYSGTCTLMGEGVAGNVRLQGSGHEELPVFGGSQATCQGVTSWLENTLGSQWPILMGYVQ